jgi:imidazolonepropionase-like amidohydrolase
MSWADQLSQFKNILDANGRLRDAAFLLVREIRAGGVRLLAGTDIGNPGLVPGLSLHRELELMAEAGMRPADVLSAATIWPAQFLNIEARSGALEPGKDADLVLLRANPLDDVRNARKIETVLLRGRFFDRANAYAERFVRSITKNVLTGSFRSAKGIFDER